MTVHKENSLTTTKSKIILPSTTYTTLLPKKKKITINIRKIGKITTYFYNKIKINTVLVSLKIQNRSTSRYKVHSTLV